MVRASACHAEGRGSEPRHSRHQKKSGRRAGFFVAKECAPGAATLSRGAKEQKRSGESFLPLRCRVVSERAAFSVTKRALQLKLVEP